MTDEAEAATGATAGTAPETKFTAEARSTARPAAETGQSRRVRLPASYWVWLGGTACSMVGTQLMAFAMVWSAAAQGGRLAGLVLTMVVLPRAVLALLGGSVADRAGAWRVMVAGDAVMVAVMLTVAGLSWGLGAPAVLLVVAALVIGLVDAFYLPSSGTVPRLLVPERSLARAMSARQMAAQLSGLLGAPLGGLVVAVAGLELAATVNAATFGVVLAILIALRSRVAITETGASSTALPGAGEASADRNGQGSGMWKRSVDGLRVALGNPVLRPALLLVVGAAAFLLPASSLLVPLLAHERHWAAGSAGIVVGAVAAGTVAVAAAVTVRGTLGRPGLVAIAGLLGSASGVATLAVVPAPAPAVSAAVLIGVGNGVFATHIAPLILGTAPPTHVARVQAVLVMAQSLPLLVTNNALGALADTIATSTVLLVCAAGLLACALASLRSGSLRRAPT